MYFKFINYQTYSFEKNVIKRRYHHYVPKNDFYSIHLCYQLTTEGRFIEANNTVPQQERKNHKIIIKIYESTQHNKSVPFGKREESQEVPVYGAHYNQKKAEHHYT